MLCMSLDKVVENCSTVILIIIHDCLQYIENYVNDIISYMMTSKQNASISSVKRLNSIITIAHAHTLSCIFSSVLSNHFLGIFNQFHNTDNSFLKNILHCSIHICTHNPLEKLGRNAKKGKRNRKYISIHNVRIL